MLNNAILDFYLRFLYHQLIPREQRKRIAIYTASFFHQTIMEEGCTGTDTSAPENIQIRNKDFVLMPAYFKEHWFLIILCYPRNINCDTFNCKEFPRIVILDSSITFLKAHRSHILQKFQSFVQNQIAHELGKSPSDVNELPVDFVPVAQQNNDYDCGMFNCCTFQSLNHLQHLLQFSFTLGLFLLEFAEKFILDNFEITIDHSNNDKDDGIDCDKKRQQIRDLIKRLSKQCSIHILD